MRKSMCLLLVLLLLTSCGIANKESSPSPQNKQSAKALNSQGNREVRNLAGSDAGLMPQSQPGQPSGAGDESDVALKDHFEQLASRVPGVKGAHCVVMNNVAVVGIDVDGTLTRSRVGNIKYSVAEAIRKDPRSVKALVTADMDVSSRIAEMGRHISKGHPVSGFASEMADIIGRIMPQLPEDTKPRGNQ
ncbi:YhcN/YlaJ family sporulation lipoprotein [Paenibacillus graminis]|uniref:Sporulation protein n=1 Tax=Paenibacillus graminis TaxID=189425 RepID=A0A089NN26_9BACL|nr:YhcN/YlaJ family sporulation lipoprotein [Paenibacillus graminis]AIQ70469.1 sporulation protein [Paenibacillus graminis]